jgi:hypothetical protein
MAHFAELDDTNTVLRVTVVNNADMLDEHGQESEAKGAQLCHDLMGGRWVQCSYNGNFRGCYPGPGFTYDPAADVFVPPPPPPEEAQV